MVTMPLIDGTHILVPIGKLKQFKPGFRVCKLAAVVKNLAASVLHVSDDAMI